jgi:hypothetical protein
MGLQKTRRHHRRVWRGDPGRWLRDIHIGKTEVFRFDPHLALGIEGSNLHVVEFEGELHSIFGPRDLCAMGKHGAGFGVAHVFAVLGTGDKSSLGIK